MNATNQYSENMLDLAQSLVELRPKAEKASKPRRLFKLGETIANGIRYWGKEKQEPYGTQFKTRRIVECICTCGNTWRTCIDSIICGNIRSCGKCNKTKEIHEK